MQGCGCGGEGFGCKTNQQMIQNFAVAAIGTAGVALAATPTIKQLNNNYSNNHYYNFIKKMLLVGSAFGVIGFAIFSFFKNSFSKLENTNDQFLICDDNDCDLTTTGKLNFKNIFNMKSSKITADDYKTNFGFSLCTTVNPIIKNFNPELHTINIFCSKKTIGTDEIVPVFNNGNTILTFNKVDSGEITITIEGEFPNIKKNIVLEKGVFENKIDSNSLNYNAIEDYLSIAKEEKNNNVEEGYSYYQQSIDPIVGYENDILLKNDNI